MSIPRERAEHVLDMLGPVIGLELGRFFGGWSLLVLGTQIGMVMDTVYAKVPPTLRDAWRDGGHHPFSYARTDGKRIVVEAYWALPDSILDDPQSLRSVLLEGTVPAQP